MQIFIDADSCPKIVRNHIVKYASNLQLKTYFVANKEISCDFNNFQMIICSSEKDAADDYIVENTTKTDLVVTRDILLAKRLVEKDVCVINDRGTCFTKDNINDRLADRNLNLALKQAGIETSKKSEYSKKHFEKFANCFDKQISKLRHL